MQYGSRFVNASPPSPLTLVLSPQGERRQEGISTKFLNRYAKPVWFRLRRVRYIDYRVKTIRFLGPKKKRQYNHNDPDDPAGKVLMIIVTSGQCQTLKLNSKTTHNGIDLIKIGTGPVEIVITIGQKVLRSQIGEILDKV